MESPLIPQATHWRRDYEVQEHMRLFARLSNIAKSFPGLLSASLDEEPTIIDSQISTSLTHTANPINLVQTFDIQNQTD